MTCDAKKMRLERGRDWIFRLGRMTRRIGICSGVLLGLIALWMAATPEGRIAWRTVLFVPQVIGTLPVNPQPWLTGEPERQQISYETQHGLGSADLYTPAGGGEHSAVLLFLGVNPAGRDDPRVIGLAEGLARSGAVVMIPWSESMTSDRVRAEEVEGLVRGFQFLMDHERVDPKRVGVGGFCVGASLVTVAAADSRIRENVKFINFFGGYFDARDLISAVLSESRFHDGEVEPWNPQQLPRRVVTAQLVEGMSDPSEVELFKAIFMDQTTIRDSTDLAGLSQEARTVFSLLSGTDLDEARRLVSGLPASSIATLRSISPESVVEDLEARVFIMHDREDRLVPAAESRRLAEALAGGVDVYHTEFSLFDHLDPTRAVGPARFAIELSKFYRHMYLVMRELR